MISCFLRWLAIAACILPAACAIPPKPAPPALRDEAPLAGIPSDARGTWPDSNWWHRYHDPLLDTLMDRALAGAPTLATARTRFDSALHSVDVVRAASGARVDASAQAARQRLSEHGLIPSRFLGFNWYNQGDIGAQFSYDFDWWGKQRATIDAVLDQARAAAAERSAAALLLQSAVADTYFAWQADQARLALARKLESTTAQLRELATLRVRQGVDPPDGLHQADVALAAARDGRAELEGSAELHRIALAALLGVAPAQLPTLESHPLPAAGATLPADARLDLIARRPDIAASRWRVEAAARRLDVARADFYPDISVQAMVGLSSIELGSLLSPSSRVASLAPALHLPLFDSGLLRAKFGAGKAELAAAVAAYDAAVVDAARDVSTQAATLAQLDARRREHRAEIAATVQLRDAAAARVRQGVTDARSELAAETQLLQQRDAALVLDAQALGTDIALIQALGGGYRAVAASAANTAPSSARTETP